MIKCVFSGRGIVGCVLLFALAVSPGVFAATDSQPEQAAQQDAAVDGSQSVEQAAVVAEDDPTLAFGHDMTVAPEPQSLAVLALGVWCLALRRRRAA